MTKYATVKLTGPEIDALLDAITCWTGEYDDRLADGTADGTLEAQSRAILSAEHELIQEHDRTFVSSARKGGD